MRKIIFGVAVFATIWSFGFAKSKKTDSEAEKKQKTEQTSEQDSKASNSDEWKEVGNQGKKALKETGIFFKDLGNTLFALSNASWIAIGITLFMLIYGSFCLVLDLQMIENGEAEQLNKDFEWYCAVSLLITVVFIYVQMLRLLVQIYLRASDN